MEAQTRELQPTQGCYSKDAQRGSHPLVGSAGDGMHGVAFAEKQKQQRNGEVRGGEKDKIKKRKKGKLSGQWEER